MKKALPVLLVLAAAGAVYFAVTQYRGASGAPAGEAQSEGASAASSAVLAFSSGSSSSGSSASSGAAASLSKEDAAQSIESRIDMDWKKYTLKESSNPVKLQGKTYRTFEMWYDDYEVGPLILLDPDDGKLYTRSYADRDADKPVPASEDKAFDKTVHTVAGTVTEDGAMMSFFIKTADGTVLAIPRYGIDTDFGDKSVVGKKVRVSYTGVISGDDMSRAFIFKAALVQ